MATPTTPYDWQVPDYTDPADAPAAFRAFADGVADTIRSGSYTPQWSQDGDTNLSIGNGSLIGRYQRVGRLVLATIVLVRGSTTNAGSAGYRWTVPYSPADYRTVAGAAMVTRSGGAAYFPAITSGVGGVMVRALLTSSGARISNTAPGSWGVGDSIVVHAMYETDDA